MNKKALIVPANPRHYWKSDVNLFIPSYGPHDDMVIELLNPNASEYWFRSVEPKFSVPLNIFRPRFYFSVPEDHVIWRPKKRKDFKVIIKQVPVLDRYKGTNSHPEITKICKENNDE